ncbi:hypothetical protein DPEC_G00079220 [Dallia pectoralis]|uniref:Uncharacterized protein n=1 Tax=Dallia pectoralis TaxID=75939 RepID=A0ACC2H4H5_DALPE|nr:hypothetical protein DPEC_G00079220 [Dallia pectoralis]
MVTGVRTIRLPETSPDYPKIPLSEARPGQADVQLDLLRRTSWRKKKQGWIERSNNGRITLGENPASIGLSQ